MPGNLSSAFVSSSSFTLPPSTHRGSFACASRYYRYFQTQQKFHSGWWPDPVYGGRGCTALWGDSFTIVELWKQCFVCWSYCARLAVALDHSFFSHYGSGSFSANRSDESSRKIRMFKGYEAAISRVSWERFHRNRVNIITYEFMPNVSTIFCTPFLK